jgi:hypothetical protein
MACLESGISPQDRWPPAVLYIDSGGSDFGGPPDPESGPVFVVPKARRADYADIVRWLSEQRALIAKSA